MWIAKSLLSWPNTSTNLCHFLCLSFSGTHPLMHTMKFTMCVHVCTHAHARTHMHTHTHTHTHIFRSNTYNTVMLTWIVDLVLFDPNPNTLKVKKNAVYEDKTQHANFWGKPLFQTTERHLTGKWWKIRYRIVISVWLSSLVVLFWCPLMHTGFVWFYSVHSPQCFKKCWNYRKVLIECAQWKGYSLSCSWKYLLLADMYTHTTAVM